MQLHAATDLTNSPPNQIPPAPANFPALCGSTVSLPRPRASAACRLCVRPNPAAGPATASPGKATDAAEPASCRTVPPTEQQADARRSSIADRPAKLQRSQPSRLPQQFPDRTLAAGLRRYSGPSGALTSAESPPCGGRGFSRTDRVQSRGRFSEVCRAS